MIIKAANTMTHKITLTGRAGKFTLTNMYKVGGVTRMHRVTYTNLETAKLCFNVTVETTEFMEKIA